MALLRMLRRRLKLWYRLRSFASINTNRRWKKKDNLLILFAVLIILLTFSSVLPSSYQMQTSKTFFWESHTLIETRTLNFSKYVKFNSESMTNVHNKETIHNIIKYNGQLSKNVHHDRSISSLNSKSWLSKSYSLNESRKLKLSGKVKNLTLHILQGNKTDNREKPTNMYSYTSNKVYFNRTSPPKHFQMWSSKSNSFCGGNFVGYNHEIALLHNVTVDSKAAIGNRGGEDFRKIFKQSESKEFFTFKKGFMKIVCDKVPKYEFTKRKIIKSGHLNKWIQTMDIQNILLNDITVIKEYYIAIVR